MTRESWDEIAELAERSLCRDLPPEEFARLEQILRTDAEARKAFADYIHDAHSLRCWGGVSSTAAPELSALDGNASPSKRGSSSISDLPRHLLRASRDYFAGRKWFIAAAALLVILGSLAWMVMRPPRAGVAGKDRQAAGPDVAARPAPRPATPERGEPRSVPHSAAVARLVRSYAPAWADLDTAPAEGDGLTAGQRLQLHSGLTELQFACGARLILQGPASLLLESGRTATLFAGKVTVCAEAPSAKGFAIHTPVMKTVDLGTEFGLEVSPTGVEQVHVFRGEVVVSPSLSAGPSVAPQHLAESQGIVVNPDTGGVKLVANNGDRFTRSFDDVQNGRHVLAYWHFEDHPVGVLAPDTQEGKAPVRASLDSSINSNDLYTWSKGTEPSFSSDVPSKTVTGTGEPNTASLDNRTPPTGGHPTRDLFTMSGWSQPSPVDLQTITPGKWTVEASVEATVLGADYQTFVGRDGMNVCDSDPKLPPFAMCITSQRHFEVCFCDLDRRSHAATCEALTVEENHWYHVAATSDGATLKLYIDSLDGNGYRLSAVTALPRTGSTALARGVWPTKGLAHMGHPFIWAVGRGCYNGWLTRGFRGLIDEVRICDVGLEPGEFLFAKLPEKRTVVSAR